MNQDIFTDDDMEQTTDDIWLRHRVVALLQSYIAPGVIADSSHIFNMARARRILRRLGVRPVTTTTALEETVARLRRQQLLPVATVTRPVHQYPAAG